MKANELMIGDWVQVPSLIDDVEHFDAWCKVKQLGLAIAVTEDNNPYKE